MEDPLPVTGHLVAEPYHHLLARGLVSHLLHGLFLRGTLKVLDAQGLSEELPKAPVGVLDVEVVSEGLADDLLFRGLGRVYVRRGREDLVLEPEEERPLLTG